MILRKNVNPFSVTRIGLVFLILANVSRYFLKRSGSVSESVADGATGFLFGVAIATLLLGVWLKSRRGAPPNGRRCA